MKKYFILIFLASLVTFSQAKPNITNVSFPSSVKLFDLYEIAFQLGNYDNPYDPKVIDVYAEFQAPNGETMKVNGFYYEEYSFKKQEDYEVASKGRDNSWRVRFTPNETGTWTFTLHAIDRQGETQLSSAGKNRFNFQCDMPQSAQGFISIANTKYLKREIVENGKRGFHPFYPTGPNIAWYRYVGSSNHPKGIYDYEKRTQTIAGSANYMRIWLNRYQYLSLYGPEFTQKVNNKPCVYFNSTLNQKDAAELDHIIAFAAQNGISVMPCVFTFGDFFNKHDSSSKWDNNPFHTILGLDSSTEFFTNADAKRISKNLLRYIVARWGYATNILCWELWNEVDNIPPGDLPVDVFHRNVINWHAEMTQYIRTLDPFSHPITTSTTLLSSQDYISAHIFEPLDIVQFHSYGNIQKAKSKEQRAHQLFTKNEEARILYPNKPFFIGEFGFGQSSGPKYADKDPFGFDTHNCLWATLFSTTMGPASFWEWTFLEEKGLMRIYEPMLKFSNGLPFLSDSFTAHHTATITKRSTVFPNGIQTYYMINAAEDTLYGWCQDTVFSYQALRRLTDREGKNGHFDENGVFDSKGYIYTLNKSKKPKPSSRDNSITLPIESQPVGAVYTIRWYDAETGVEITNERTTTTVKKTFLKKGKHITFAFPSTVRNLEKKSFSNTYGDAVFAIILDHQNENTGSLKKKEDASVKPKRILIKKGLGSQ